MTRFNATLLLILATAIWGFAFIAQKSAMDSMGPLTFIGMRYILGGLVIAPLAWFEYKKRGIKISAKEWAIIAFLSVNFFLGSWLQQWGLVSTSVTNGGFLTGLYVFFVPLILLIVFRTKPHHIVWICTPLAMFGLFLLTGGSLDKINSGDYLIITSAIFWAMHVLGLGYAARLTKMPLVVSCLPFLFAGLFSGSMAFLFESPTISGISGGWIEILYAGILSTAVAFTLQAIGQMHVPPANAAIILSGESLFAAIGGAVIMGERLIPIGYFGAFLILLSILLVESVPAFLQSKKQAQSP
jgi:drug/metabolite transporter (DMT)-like permease